MPMGMSATVPAASSWMLSGTTCSFSDVWAGVAQVQYCLVRGGLLRNVVVVVWLYRMDALLARRLR
jgi:hypothetical protein